MRCPNSKELPSSVLLSEDDTPGCTKEACAFRDRQGEIAQLGAHVLGVSPDTTQSHAKFRDKYQLNFLLLAILITGVAEEYGAWREKNMYGKKSMGSNDPPS